MGVAVTAQDAVITNLIGQLEAKDVTGNIRDLTIGDAINSGERLIFSPETQFTLQMADGTLVNEQSIIQLESDITLPSNLEQTFAIDTTEDLNIDDEIAAIQAQILAGDDPSLDLPATAAGSGTGGNEGSSSFITLARSGNETIAGTGHESEAVTEATPLPTQNDTVIIDTTPPILTITLDENVTTDDVINFAEALQDIAITGVVSGEFSAGDTVTLTINGVNYTGQTDTNGQFSILVSGADLAADPNTVINANVTTTDTAGNSNNATDSEGYSVNTNTPSVVVNIVDAQLTVSETSEVTFTFTEQVTGFTVEELDTSGGTVTDLTTDDNGITWSATFTPNSNFTGSANVTVLNNSYTDLNGNLGIGGSDITEITIDLNNLNEAPEFRSGIDVAGDAANLDTYDFGSLNEGAASGILVGTVIADDPDTGDNLRFSFEGGGLTNGIFDIDATSGQITLNQDIDDAELGAFDFNVLVTDLAGLTDIAAVAIDLNNLNEAPEFRSGVDVAGDAANLDTYDLVSLNEGAASGTLVGTVIADDPDAGDNLRFSFEGGGLTNGIFDIDATSGQITLNQDIDDVELGAFNFNVLVTDLAGLTDIAAVAIDLNNLNEAPEFRSGIDVAGDAANLDTYDFGSLNEGAASGTLVGTVIADDPDAGDNLRFSFEGGGLTNGVFDIDATSGQLTLNQDIDDAELGTFNLNVIVTDLAGLIDIAVVNITLDNVDDIPEITSITSTRVSEEGLLNGIKDNGIAPADTTNEVTDSGVISFTDVDSNAFSVTLTGPIGMTSGGDDVDVWSRNGDTFTGSTQGGLLVITLVLGEFQGISPDFSINYDTTLHAPIDHPLTNAEDVLEFNFGAIINNLAGDSINSNLSIIIEDDAPIITDESAILVSDSNIPDTLLGNYSFTTSNGNHNILDFDGFTVTANGFTSATDSTLTSAIVYGNNNGIGVKSVASPYHNLNAEIDFRQFADGTEASEEMVITLDSGTLAYGINMKFASMFGGELEVGLVEFYRDGQLIIIQTFSSDANDGNYAAIFQTLEGGFDKIIIKATDNGINNNSDNSDLTVKSIEFLGRDGLAIGYATGVIETLWGADERGLLVFTGTNETGLLTQNGDAIIISQSGNTLVGQTTSNTLVFKVEFTPGTGQWDFYQYQMIQAQIDGQLDFNLIATDGDGDNLTGHFAVIAKTIPLVPDQYALQNGTMGTDELTGSINSDYLIGGTGNDTLNAGEGNDILIGGKDTDSLDVGIDLDADVLIWQAGDADGSTDTIYNFNVLHDTLDISEILLDEESHSLESYFSINFTAGNTSITLDSNGADLGGDTLIIELIDVDLSVLYSDTNETVIIDSLLFDEAIIVNTLP